MWPLSEKSLLRFGAEPLLVSQLQRYRKLDFKQIVIVANPRNKSDISVMIANLTKHLKIDIAVQEQPLGMGDAILKAEPFIDPDAPVYITQVHDVVDEKLHNSLLKAFKKNPKESYLAGVEREDYFPGGYLIVDDNGHINGIVEKPGAENRPSNLVNIVAHIHSRAGALFEAIQAEYASETAGDDHYERAMDKLMKKTVYRVVPYKGYWAALKYPWHVLDIMDYYLDQINGQVIAEDAFIAETASIVGNVYIGAGARVYPGAAVVGPAYIGPGTVVGNNSLVRNSMVLNNCEVGFTTEIARSYVAEHCAMHACRVLDSVFAPHVNFSAGCTTANLRIDRGPVPCVVKGERINSGREKLGAIIGRNAFLAVDVMTMPGVKIGDYANVGPGTHVMDDIQARQRVYVKQEIQVIDDADQS